MYQYTPQQIIDDLARHANYAKSQLPDVSAIDSISAIQAIMEDDDHAHWLSIIERCGSALATLTGHTDCEVIDFIQAIEAHDIEVDATIDDFANQLANIELRMEEW